ncbi:MAG: type II secretion system F family protein [Patescibacteria group bacterium]
MKFKIIAIKNNGGRYEEVREASDKNSIFHDLRISGDTVISVTEEKSNSNNKLKLKLEGFFHRISTNDKISFARNLGSMLESGLPLIRSLSVLERQTKNPKLKDIFVTMQNNINKGDSLSQSFAGFPKVFPPIFVSMVKAGEESGTIAKSLKSISDQMEKIYMLMKRLRGAMIYPAIVITVMVIIGVLLLIFLVPSLTATFKDLNVELPLSTRIIIKLSDFLKNHYIVVAGAILLFITAFSFVLKTKGGKKFFSFIALKMPIASTLIKESNSAKTARTLSSLLSSGVDFLVAIRITRDVVQNPFYRKVLKQAEEGVQKGDVISAIFLRPDVQNLYPPFVGEMASIGEETGKLSVMLSNVADFYEDEVNQKTKNFSTIIEPLLMVCIGLFVGIFAVSMLGPIYSLADAI